MDMTDHLNEHGELCAGFNQRRIYGKEKWLLVYWEAYEDPQQSPTDEGRSDRGKSGYGALIHSEEGNSGKLWNKLELLRKLGELRYVEASEEDKKDGGAFFRILLGSRSRNEWWQWFNREWNCTEPCKSSTTLFDPR
jgi:hypothetical protein